MNGQRGTVELIRSGGKIVSVVPQDGRRFNTKAVNLRVMLGDESGAAAVAATAVPQAALADPPSVTGAVSAGVLVVGARVRVTGLEGKDAGLNGSEGVVEMVRASGQIVAVLLDEGRRFNTRGKNLEVIVS